MDGFYLFVGWTVFIFCAAFATGTQVASVDLTRDCASKGEITVKGRVIQCEITHQIIDGRRVALEKLK